jgi:hypothetical protein
MQDQDFLVLLERSRQVEEAILNRYKETYPKAKRAEPGKKEYDIFCPAVGNVEIKEDKMALDTGCFAFEFEDAKGDKSGIAVTTAGEFVVVDRELVTTLKTVSLLFMIKECPDRRIIQMGYTTKEGKRAKGYLVPRNYVIHSPYSRTEKRWFK